MLKKVLKLSSKVRQRRDLVKKIMADKTNFDICDPKIAEVIVRWCGTEENSIEFFSECLVRIGIKLPVKMVQLVKNKDYIISIKEIETDIMRDLYISKQPKENIKAVTIWGAEKVEFMQNANSLKIEYKSINLKYFDGDSIRMSVGENIDIILRGYKWNEEEDLYKKAKALIQDLDRIDRNLEPYEYYISAKKEIVKYYSLEGVNFELLMNKFSLITRDGHLIMYNDPEKGILVKRYFKWIYKKYSRNGVEIIWEDKIKCNKDLPDKELENYLDMAQKALEGVENQEY